MWGSLQRRDVRKHTRPPPSSDQADDVLRSELLLKVRSCRVERLGPSLVEPSMDGTDAALVEPVDPARPLRGFRDQASLLQDAKVLRDGRPGDGHGAGEFADRAGSVGQTLEDLPPCRVAQRRDSEERLCVSHHLL